MHSRRNKRRSSVGVRGVLLEIHEFMCSNPINGHEEKKEKMKGRNEENRQITLHKLKEPMKELSLRINCNMQMGRRISFFGRLLREKEIKKIRKKEKLTLEIRRRTRKSG